MGVINLTPDSFSGDGILKKNKQETLSSAVSFAKKLIKDGADILDIGGESTRPGSKPVAASDEINRIIPVIKKLASQTKTPISADTYKPLVARHALDAGAAIINNIMGSRPNKKLLKAVQQYKASIVLMHIRGTPRTMQNNIRYRNLINEIIEELRKSIEICLEIGIKSDKIIIDPGIGFAKTAEQNLEILNRLTEFRVLKRPVLVGTSRKSFIGKVLDKDARNRLAGTTATVSAAILRGAHIVRIHDVKHIKEAVRMTDAILNQAL